MPASWKSPAAVKTVMGDIGRISPAQLCGKRSALRAEIPFAWPEFHFRASVCGGFCTSYAGMRSDSPLPARLRAGRFRGDETARFVAVTADTEAQCNFDLSSFDQLLLKPIMLGKLDKILNLIKVER